MDDIEGVLIWILEISVQASTCTGMLQKVQYIFMIKLKSIQCTMLVSVAVTELVALNGLKLNTKYP